MQQTKSVWQSFRMNLKDSHIKVLDRSAQIYTSLGVGYKLCVFVQALFIYFISEKNAGYLTLYIVYIYSVQNCQSICIQCA